MRLRSKWIATLRLHSVRNDKKRMTLFRRCHCERSEAIQRTLSRVRNGQGEEPCREGTFNARWARLGKYFL